MALEALKQFVADRDEAINAKIESIGKNDRAGSPTSDFKGQGNIKPLPGLEIACRALQRP